MAPAPSDGGGASAWAPQARGPLAPEGLVAVLSPVLRRGDGTTSLALFLDPPELGVVRAVVTTRGHDVTIALFPATEAGKAALQEQRHALEQHLALDGAATATVLVGDGSSGGREEPSRSARETGRGPSAKAASDAGPTALEAARQDRLVDLRL